MSFEHIRDYATVFDNIVADLDATEAALKKNGKRTYTLGTFSGLLQSPMTSPEELFASVPWDRSGLLLWAK